MAVGAIDFVPLQREHFSALTGWLQEPLVARWWNHETTPKAIERDFGPSIDGQDGTEFFLASLGDSPFGLIQRYPIASEPEYAKELAAVCVVPEGALSIDYLIGEPASRGHGQGVAMIAAFVATCWGRYPDATTVIVPVAVGNRASWRALERAGFHRIAEGELTPDNPRDPRDHYVYAIDRPRE